jgi:hypothetical protein
MTPIHERVSRGGGAVLTRGRRHSGGGVGMGVSSGRHRGGYAYAERISVELGGNHCGHLLSYCLSANLSRPACNQAAKCGFEGRR